MLVAAFTAALGLTAILLLGPGVIAPAGAESPTEVAEDLAVDGVFLAPGRVLDEEGLIVAVQEARARGLRMVVVAPNDPQPTASAFARRVAEASDADVAIVFPREGGLEAFAVDDFESGHLRALGAARAQATPLGAVQAYTAEVLSEPERPVPPIISQLVTVLVLLALILGAVVAIEQLLRRLLRRGGRGRNPVSRRNLGDELPGRTGTLVDR